MLNDPNATAILINCNRWNPDNTKVHTDFFAIKPEALAPYNFLDSTISNAEFAFTSDISADILEKGNHRWINNSAPIGGGCRARQNRDEFRRHVAHTHVGEDHMQNNFTCNIPF